MRPRTALAPRQVRVWGWIVGLGVVLLAACAQGGTAVAPTPPASSLVAPVTTAGQTPVPVGTPEPLAATVNGGGILLAALQAEVQRCQTGLTSAGVDAGNCPESALQSLIEQKVVEQAAGAAQLTVTDEEVSAAEAHIQQSLGGANAYAAWLAANFYTPDGFRQALRQDRLRAKMADQVMAAVGTQAEQVHALALVVADEATAQDVLAQIQSGADFLVADEATAQDVLAQIQSGADFSTLALKYSLDLSSRATGGDLGWFPRGVLAVPEVEAAAFALKPGETSGVIHSAVGYQIVKVLQIDPARPLSPAAQQTLRAQAYQAWLTEALSKAVIQKIVSP
jgi:parvulin-like peptidyl-prolyl isomerase